MQAFPQLLRSDIIALVHVVQTLSGKYEQASFAINSLKGPDRTVSAAVDIMVNEARRNKLSSGGENTTGEPLSASYPTARVTVEVPIAVLGPRSNRGRGRGGFSSALRPACASGDLPIGRGRTTYIMIQQDGNYFFQS